MSINELIVSVLIIQIIFYYLFRLVQFIYCKEKEKILFVEVYLVAYLKKNGFKVSNTDYFIFANAQKDRDNFNDRLDFEKILIPYEGNDDWIESTI